MSPEHYLSIIPSTSRFGAIINLPRRIVWKLVRPYFAALILRNTTLEEQFVALKKEMLATNHRITWLESLLEDGAGKGTASAKSAAKPVAKAAPVKTAAIKSAVAKPASAKPSTVKSAAVRSAATKTTTAKPAMAKPAVRKPPASKS